MVQWLTIIAILATLVGSFVSTYLVRKLIRPKLVMEGDVFEKTRAKMQTDKQNPTPFLGERIFHLSVSNSGYKAAKNAKASFVLSGSTSLQVPDGDDVDLELQSRFPLRWSEADRPATSELNPGETVNLEILGLIASKYSLLLPGTSPQDEVVPLFVAMPTKTDTVPLRMDTPERESPRFQQPHFSIEADAEFPSFLSNMGWTQERFGNINWSTAKIEITANNADRYECYFDIESNEGELEISKSDEDRISTFGVVNYLINSVSSFRE